MSIATISEVVAALRVGSPVIVVDDEGRENEGDAVMAAQFATQEWIALMVRHTNRYLSAPLPLPLMPPDPEAPRRPPSPFWVDPAGRYSTGISAAERAHTLRVLADPTATAARLIRPGHILPLRAVDGGVRERAGHTEAAVDLMRLAGLEPVAVIGELVADEGEMLRMPALIEFGERENVPVTTVHDILAWIEHTDPSPVFQARSDAHSGQEGIRSGCESFPTRSSAQAHPDTVIPESSPVRFDVETTVPTTHGPFRMRAYRDLGRGTDHVAIIAGDPSAQLIDPVVRVHSECVTGEAFGSVKCECGPQLDAALDMIGASGGIVVYLRGQEGPGICLLNKLRAYRLQENGLDTLDANVELGLPVDARDYSAAAAILLDLGVTRVRLLTNNPDKATQLAVQGINIVEQVPLVVGVDPANLHYLETKRTRLGHTIGRNPPL